MSEDSQQVVLGLINSVETRWIDYENDEIYSVSTLVDPRFKEVSFSASALDRFKKLLLSLMRRVITNTNEVQSSEGCVHSIRMAISAAGYISNQRRSCLNGEHIHQLVFLNKNT